MTRFLKIAMDFCCCCFLKKNYTRLPNKNTKKNPTGANFKQTIFKLSFSLIQVFCMNVQYLYLHTLLWMSLWCSWLRNLQRLELLLLWGHACSMELGRAGFAILYLCLLFNINVKDQFLHCFSWQTSEGLWDTYETIYWVLQEAHSACNLIQELLW